MNKIGAGPQVYQNITRPAPLQPEYIDALKQKDSLLKSLSRDTLQDAKAYLDHLTDLNRFEEAYAEACAIVEFFPVLKPKLAQYAYPLGDERTVFGHVRTLRPDADASYDEWLSVILYHDLNGTIDELLHNGQPLPKDRAALALIYYLGKDHQKVCSVLSGTPQLNEIEIWLLCASCKFLNKNEEAEFLFDKILRDEAKISSLLFLQNLATVIFRNSITNENRDRALIYLQKIHIAKPGWLLLLTLFDSVYNNETKTIWQTRYEKCLKAFPSLYNKMRLIELWNLPKEKEFHALYALLRGNPLSRFLFRLAFDSSKGDPNLHKEVISYARSKSKDTIYYAAQEVASECLGVTRTGDDTDGEALLAKIEALLKKAPHHQTLIYNKIFLITYLMRYQEAINEIKLYIGLFGYTNAIVNFIDSRERPELSLLRSHPETAQRRAMGLQRRRWRTFRFPARRWDNTRV